MKTDISIIGWWVSGIWMSIIFEKYWLKNYHIFESWEWVWNSFANWTKETEFISPSFVSEDFQIYDLNSVSFETNDSPWRFLQKERFTGKEYQKYLDNIKNKYSLNISYNTKIVEIKRNKDKFLLKSKDWQTIETKILIYAAWEYTYPYIPNIIWKEYAIHNSKIKSYKDLKKPEVVIVWWYESGIDAAYNCIKNGQKVILIEQKEDLAYEDPDPSLSISLHSKKRLSKIIENKNLKIVTNFKLERIGETQSWHELTSTKWEKINTIWDIVFATGFDFSQGIAKNLFEFEGSSPVLNNEFESSKTKNLFAIGPMIKIEWTMFCFIYKYKLLFPTIAFYVMKKLWIDNSKLEKDFHILWKEEISKKSWLCC